MTKTHMAQQRLMAWLIDLLIVVGLSVLIRIVFAWLATTAYWLCRDGLFEGQSIGKRLIGLKVILQPSGGRCTIKASMIRNLLWMIPFVNLLMGLTGLYYLFNDSAGRHWGDRLADTTVVKA